MVESKGGISRSQGFSFAQEKESHVGRRDEHLAVEGGGKEGKEVELSFSFFPEPSSSSFFQNPR